LLACPPEMHGNTSGDALRKKNLKKKILKGEGGRAGGVGWGGVSSATSLQLHNPKIYEHCSTLGGFVTCVSEKK